MSEQLMKPVWRMNGGQGVPSDFSFKAILYSDGDLMEFPVNEKSHMLKVRRVWDIDAKFAYITFYQTNRAKAAKYERVGCYACDGDGFYLGENSRVERKCPHCNGKGYTLEAIK